MNNLWLVRTSASVHFHWVIFEFIHSIDGNAKACHHYSTFACASPVSLHGLHFFWQITTYLASIYVYTYIHIDIIYTYTYVYIYIQTVVLMTRVMKDPLRSASRHEKRLRAWLVWRPKAWKLAVVPGLMTWGFGGDEALDVVTENGTEITRN